MGMEHFCYTFLIDISQGKYFIDLRYDGNVYETVNGQTKTYPFPTNIHTKGHEKTHCGVLIYDDLSPRIGFEECDKKLPFICEVNCMDKAGDVVKAEEMTIGTKLV